MIRRRSPADLTGWFGFAIVRSEAPTGLLKNMKMFKKIINFLKEVRLEMKKVNWPGKEQTFRYTLIILGASAAVAMFLGGMDFIFNLLLREFIL